MFFILSSANVLYFLAMFVKIIDSISLLRKTRVYFTYFYRTFIFWSSRSRKDTKNILKLFREMPRIFSMALKVKSSWFLSAFLELNYPLFSMCKILSKFELFKSRLFYSFSELIKFLYYYILYENYFSKS